MGSRAGGAGHEKEEEELPEGVGAVRGVSPLGYASGIPYLVGCGGYGDGLGDVGREGCIHVPRRAGFG